MPANQGRDTSAEVLWTGDLGTTAPVVRDSTNGGVARLSAIKHSIQRSRLAFYAVALTNLLGNLFESWYSPIRPPQ